MQGTPSYDELKAQCDRHEVWLDTLEQLVLKLAQAVKEGDRYPHDPQATARQVVSQIEDARWNRSRPKRAAQNS